MAATDEISKLYDKYNIINSTTQVQEWRIKALEDNLKTMQKTLIKIQIRLAVIVATLIAIGQAVQAIIK